METSSPFDPVRNVPVNRSPQEHLFASETAQQLTIFCGSHKAQEVKCFAWWELMYLIARMSDLLYFACEFVDHLAGWLVSIYVYDCI